MEYLFLIKDYLLVGFMITLVGIGHVFNLRSKIDQIIHEKNPDVVCVELDEKRYHALLIQHKENYVKRNSSLPVIYRILAKFQDTAAKWYGVHAGDEMLTALQTAREMNTPVVFIDMDAQILFKEMLHSMPLREKIRLLLSSISSLFATKSMVEKELMKLQSNYDRFLREVEKRFPTVKKTLIDKRNVFMVEQLQDLTQRYSKIVAVVGDGHIPGMERLLKSRNVEVETIRLKKLIGDNDTGRTVSFKLTYTQP
ncbi:MAG TPA: hypothetical protein EYP23_02340 [Thermoplasmata archaeon]|nr:hypothetical protein [Thermoplasmata archaeon]